MAVNSKSYSSNSKVGVPQVAFNFDIFDSSSTPKFALGHMIEIQDGRRLRYASFGYGVSQNRCVSMDLSESQAALNCVTVVAPASAATTTDGTAGSKHVEGTMASVGGSTWAGGYLVVTAGTGRGYTYRIKGNTVTGLPDGPASGNVRIELYDPIQTTLTADSDVIVVGQRFSNCEHTTYATDMLVAGVTTRAHVLGNYGWVQTRGPIGILEEGTIPQGSLVVPSDGVDGAVAQMGNYVSSTDILDVAQMPIIGYCSDPGADTTAEGTTAAIVVTLE
jgi:hypothetical protein